MNYSRENTRNINKKDEQKIMEIRINVWIKGKKDEKKKERQNKKEKRKTNK